jgi:hypothetical protein
VKKLSVCAAIAIAATATATPALAADPGSWVRTGLTELPLYDYQGITHDPSGDFYFDGVFKGLARTDSTGKEEARSDVVIPADIEASVGFNHIGDLSWDKAEGGRLILPLECYTAGQANGGNTCGIGGFAVADPKTLTWRYWVKLDPADIPKAMWAEADPDGKQIWTSAGRDLLVYNAADVTAANQQPAGPLLKPARRLPGAVPDHGITGATFVDGRLFLAGQDDDTFRVTSVDTTTGAQRLELETTLSGESEGLDLLPALGGTLHWQVMPFPSTDNPPTFAKDKAAVLSFLPRAQAKVVVKASPARAKVGKKKTFTFRVANGAGSPLAGVTVKFAGKRAKTDAKGRARVVYTPRKAGKLTATAAADGLKSGRAVIQVSS